MVTMYIVILLGQASEKKILVVPTGIDAIT